MSIVKEKIKFVLLFLFLLSFITTGIIFYLYAINTSSQAPPANEIKVNKQLYREVLNRLNAREANIQQGIEINYLDIFR